MNRTLYMTCAPSSLDWFKIIPVTIVAETERSILVADSSGYRMSIYKSYSERVLHDDMETAIAYLNSTIKDAKLEALKVQMENVQDTEPEIG